LGDYDKFQFENRVKGDYSNVGGLQVYEPDLDTEDEEDKWCDWEDSNGDNIDNTEFPPLSDATKQWLSESFTKIALYVNSEEELDEIYKKAKEAELPCSLIEDNGKTEFGGVKTKTAVAIGPAFHDQVKDIVSHLKLL